MASLKELKNRIASVKATQKITKAMQMVAAAKLRRAQEAAIAARPYAHRLGAVVANLAGAMAGRDDAPLLLSGNGRDEVTFFETVIDAHTTVFGGASATTSGNDGDDLVTLTRITILPGVHAGDGGDDFDGVDLPNSLRVDGQNGSNHVEVTLWGIDDPDHHETRIEVVGSGTDPLAINTLTVNTGAGDDVVLLRRITLALQQLAGPLDLDRAGPSKQHGLARGAVKRPG